VAGGVAHEVVANELHQPIEASGGDALTRHRLPTKLLARRSVEGADVQRRRRGADHRVDRIPDGGPRLRIEIAVAPSDVEVGRITEVLALRPDRWIDVGAAHGETRVPAVTDDPYVLVRTAELLCRKRRQRHGRTSTATGRSDAHRDDGHPCDGERGGDQPDR
jgi:hypothetical protein